MEEMLPLTYSALDRLGYDITDLIQQAEDARPTPLGCRELWGAAIQRAEKLLGN